MLKFWLLLQKNNIDKINNYTTSVAINTNTTNITNTSNKDNIFHNFTLYKDPELGKAYKDVYDFNKVEKLVPGEAFVIKGAIK